jgi:hypothetical protein
MSTVRIAIVISVLIGPLLAHASPRTVSGTVIDWDGSPVSGALVIMSPRPHELPDDLTMTDSAGKFLVKTDTKMRFMTVYSKDQKRHRVLSRFAPSGNTIRLPKT